jgi:hypothetical protein
MSLILNPCLHAGGGFDPLSVLGCVLWMDPEQSGYADNDLVSFAQDFSGTSSLYNPGGFNRPTNKTNQINGRSAFRFSSASQYLYRADVLDGNTTIFVVLKPTTTDFTRVISSNVGFVSIGLNAYTIYFNNDPYALFGDSFGSSRWGLITCQPGSSSVYTKISLDNNAETVGVAYPGTVAFTGMRISANGGGFSEFYGDIACILIYDSLLGDSDKTYIKNGLIDIYNL